MEIVRLNERVMVQSLVTLADAGGGQSRSWSDLREVWAQVERGPAGADAGNGQSGYRRQFIITLRWAPDLPEPMRLIVAQTPLNVIAGQRLSAPAADYFQAECEEHL